MSSIGPYKVHPAADMFPMMPEDELAELAADIRERGQVEPIVISGATLLDGRNRMRACKLAGVVPVTWEWDGTGGTPVGFIIAKNVRRRHLDPSQRGMLGADLLPMLEVEARERQLQGGEEGRRRKTSGLPPRGGNRGPTAAAEAAKAVGVGTRTVERAKVVAERSPELAAKVRAGEVSLKAAERQVRQRDQVAAIATYRPPVGRFSLIAADPPWSFYKRPEDTTSRGHVQYPTMTTDEICRLSIPADVDCVLAMWTTQQHLLRGDAQRVVEAWGFELRGYWTWVKQSEDGRLQIGVGDWGRNCAEPLIIATRGRPVFHAADVPTVFFAPRREHSRKPDEAYTLLERCCPAPARLELFAREARAGWTTSGAEGELFDAPATTRALLRRPG
ncbi:MAG: ParB N-terminal domain-containing protein [Myxococcales bacterium]|nr:ParB N-terminal domain-containing protein [Myxococcales bacterium]